MRKALFAAAAAAVFFAWAALVGVLGGIQIRIAGVLFRSRDPVRALMIVLALSQFSRVESVIGRTSKTARRA